MKAFPKMEKLKWHRWRLIYKLLLFYMPLIVLPVILGMYFVISNFNEMNREVIKKNTEDLLDLVVEKLDQEFHRFESLSLQFFVDGELHRLLQVNAETYLQSMRVKNDLEKRMLILLGNFRPYILSTIINWGENEIIFGRRISESFYKEHAEFFSDMEEGEGSVVWEFDTTNEAGENVILLGRNINHLERYNKIGQVVFVIDPSILTHILAETKISNNASFHLYSKENNLFLETGNLSSDFNQGKYLITDIRSHKYDWTLKTMIPLQQLYDRIERMVYLSILITIFCVLLGLVVTQLIVADMVLPIKKLMKNMKQGVRGVEPRKLKRFRGAREVTELNDTFISVLYEIQQLNDKVMKTQEKKQQSEIKALQHQITPHFLYNTLNSIRWMAIIQKQDNIKEMVDSLTSLLSYSLSDLGQYVTIDDELNILNDYVKIQKVRYQDFIMNVNISNRICKLYIIKFLLQPIVENAVIHGISEANRSGEIHLSASKEKNELHILISDNGIGMDSARLRQIRNSLINQKESNHLGLRNVHERIQLHYGRTYGITIESELDKGTKVKLVLPWIEIKEQGWT